MAGWICDGEGYRAAAKGSGVRLVRATARSGRKASLV